MYLHMNLEKNPTLYFLLSLSWDVLSLHFILKAIYIPLKLSIIKLVERHDKLVYKANKVSWIYLL